MRRAMFHLDYGDASIARALAAEPTPVELRDDRDWPAFIKRLREKLNETRQALP